jgi:hypothetical protein
MKGLSMKLPLTEPQFRSALAKGLGRAKLHVQQFGSDGMAKAILDACLTCGVHDPQSEGTRGAWLYEIIMLMGDLDRYRRPILEALAAATPATASEATAMQLATLACNSEAGSAEARQAIFDRFAMRHAEWGAIGADEIAYLDGLDGLAFVASAVGNAEDWIVECAIWSAEEEFGVNKVNDFLTHRARNDHGLAAFLAGRATCQADAQARQAARAGICGPSKRLRRRRPLTKIAELSATFAPGDGERIEQFLPKTDDAHALHDAALDIMDLSRTVKSPELASTLRWVYEVNPCSVCREHAMEDMIELRVAPPELLAECLHDSSERVRQLAREAMGMDDEES